MLSDERSRDPHFSPHLPDFWGSGIVVCIVCAEFHEQAENVEALLVGLRYTSTPLTDAAQKSAVSPSLFERHKRAETWLTDLADELLRKVPVPQAPGPPVPDRRSCRLSRRGVADSLGLARPVHASTLRQPSRAHLSRRSGRLPDSG